MKKQMDMIEMNTQIAPSVTRTPPRKRNVFTPVMRQPAQTGTAPFVSSVSAMPEPTTSWMSAATCSEIRTNCQSPD